MTSPGRAPQGLEWVKWVKLKFTPTCKFAEKSAVKEYTWSCQRVYLDM